MTTSVTAKGIGLKAARTCFFKILFYKKTIGLSSDCLCSICLYATSSAFLVQQAVFVVIERVSDSFQNFLAVSFS